MNGFRWIILDVQPHDHSIRFDGNLDYFVDLLGRVAIGK